jgi:hypothetical protein
MTDFKREPLRTPRDDLTPEERRAWLTQYFEEMPQREKERDSFNLAAVLCMGLPMVALAVFLLIMKLRGMQ